MFLASRGVRRVGRGFQACRWPFLVSGWPRCDAVGFGLSMVLACRAAKTSDHGVLPISCLEPNEWLSCMLGDRPCAWLHGRDGADQQWRLREAPRRSESVMECRASPVICLGPHASAPFVLRGTPSIPVKPLERCADSAFGQRSTQLASSVLWEPASNCRSASMS